MEITQTEQNGILILKIIGRLDAVTATEAEKTIDTIMEGETSKIVFDFSQLEYLSSGGLRVILGTAKELKRRDGNVALCSLNEYVKEIFEVSGLEALIPIKDTIDEGLQSMS
ncbi:MAG: STAS domain-containing protein [Desulfobacterales bacterium]|nr:STAS domain-containing protein [Desulfobacterales bacterium]